MKFHNPHFRVRVTREFRRNLRELYGKNAIMSVEVKTRYAGVLTYDIELPRLWSKEDAFNSVFVKWRADDNNSVQWRVVRFVRITRVGDNEFYQKIRIPF